jgi:hypothetical protein
MSDPARVSDAAAGAPGPRAPTRQLFPLKVTVCAWCGSRSIAGIWDELDVVLHTFLTGRRHFVTHGICPTCFEQNAPGTPYPEPPSE